MTVVQAAPLFIPDGEAVAVPDVAVIVETATPPVIEPESDLKDRMCGMGCF